MAGGIGGEREVSLRSGRAILGALREVAAPGLEIAWVEIDERGQWLLPDVRCRAIDALVRWPQVELWFLALHGGSGENGTLQGLFEAAGARYTGSGVAASALCMDKLASRGVAQECGVRVSRGLCFDWSQWQRERAAIERAAAAYAGGYVIKPRRGGSSVATFVGTGAQFSEHVERAFGALSGANGAPLDDLLLEQQVEGVEVSCGVLGTGDGARALPVIEIQPRGDAFFDYVQKYAADGAREVCPSESLPAEACQEIERLAVRMHRALDCRGYSRSDFIVPVVGDRRAVFLETNTLPGMTERSLLPQEARVAGLSFERLCLAIAREAWSEFPALPSAASPALQGEPAWRRS